MKFLKNRLIIVILITIPAVLLISLTKTDTSQKNIKVEYDHFWTYKVHSKKKYNMLIIGDSRVYRGISPNAINKIIPNIKILNFAFSAGKLNNEIYAEARKRLDNKSKIKVILVGITPGGLTDIDNNQLHEIMKLTNAEVFDKIYMNYFISKFITPLKPSELFRTHTKISPGIVNEVYHDNGWAATNSVQPNQTELLEVYRKGWSGTTVSTNKINDLCSAITEWKNQNILVFALRIPAAREMEELENSVSGFNEEEIKENIIKAGGHWIELTDKYSKYRTYDGSHLDEKSALFLSEDIAKDIKEQLKEH